MKLLAFYSDKGGVGKSLLTYNVAVVLKNAFCKEVVIVDTTAGYCSLSETRKNDLQTYSDIDIEGEVKIVKITQLKEFLDYCKQMEGKVDYMVVDIGLVNEINMYFLMKCNFIFMVMDDDISVHYKTYRSLKDVVGRFDEFNVEQVKIVFNKLNRDYSIEKLKNLCEHTPIYNLDDFIFEPIYMDRSRFNSINTLNNKIHSDMYNLTEAILNVMEGNL